MSELKRYLDRLANGPLLDSAVSVGPYLHGEYIAGETPVEGDKLAKRRIRLTQAKLKAAPLKVRTKPRKAT